MSFRILLTGAFPYKEEHFNQIKELPVSVDFLQMEQQAVQNPEQYDGVVCNGLFLHNDITRFSNLKFIQLTSAGLDRVPLEYIKEHNIRLHNARGVYSVPMAEWVVLSILSLYKHANTFRMNQSRHLWEKDRGVLELAGKTAAVIGCGSVGQEVAKRLKAFDVTVLGVDVCEVACDFFCRCYPIDELDSVLTQSDIVILTLPLTEETRHLFDADKFNLMQDSIFINVSRGGVVCEQDLIAALQSGLLKGAALDVFEREPLSETSSLWDLENVIVTPHNSFVGDGVEQRMFRVIMNHLEGWLKDENICSITEK